MRTNGMSSGSFSAIDSPHTEFTQFTGAQQVLVELLVVGHGKDIAIEYFQLLEIVLRQVAQFDCHALHPGMAAR